MIDNDLKKLVRYIEEINDKKPIDILENSIDEIKKNINSSQDFYQFEEKIKNDFDNLIKDYKKKDISNPYIVLGLYNFIVNYLRLSLVEEQANLLGIEKKTYKQEMKLLFKGKKN